MDRFDTLHHQISEQKLLVSIQGKQLRDLEAKAKDNEALGTIVAAMHTVQLMNLAKLAKLEKELRDLG